MNESVLDQIKEFRKDNHNFQSIKKQIGEERLKEFINSIYPKFTITEIETITGIPDSTLAYWFEQLKILFIRHRIKSKAFHGNEDSEIVVSKDGITFKAVTIKITPELAYIIGFTLGDGSIQQYMIEVFNKDRKLREVLFEYLKPYGTITEEERLNGLWRLRLSNGIIANLIKDKDGIRKDTIDYIFSKDELAKKFIAAFWDAEGTGRKQGNYYHLYLYNSNEYLINKICNFLKFKGIKYSIHTRKTRDKNSFINGHEVKSKKILYRICIPKSCFLSWVSEIGLNLNHSKKRGIVNEMLKLYGGK